MKHFLKTAAPVVMLCLMPLSAWADPVNFSFDGEITFVSAIEPFGVSVGETVSVTGMFDDLLTGIGAETVSFGSGNMLQIFIGSTIFDETDDDRYSGGVFPSLDFIDGSLVLFDYINNGFGGFETGQNKFFSDDSVIGIWDYGSFETIPVNDDDDNDGVPNDDDLCPDNTLVPEGVPTVRLNPNHWALIDGDSVFDTLVKGKGKGPNRSYTIEDTLGCSCEQIVEMQGLGDGHTKFGCSISAMDDWVELVNP